MPLRTVQSKQNPSLKELRRSLAFSHRAKGDLIGIEGLNLLEEALHAGLRVERVFAAEGSEHLLESLSLASETEILLLPRELLDSAQTTETPQPIAALIEPPEWSWTDILDHKNPLIVILAALQDPGNVGTILRSAEAFGATSVLCLPGTVHPWNPKAVRASAGSIFRLPLRIACAEECFARLREASIKIWSTAVHDAEPAHCADLATPLAIMIGNEGNGVSAELAAQADGALTISCPGPVESLNAAVAASVLFYEASRQRVCAKQPRGGRR
jgi:TrmH family RNA methyltransferase